MNEKQQQALREVIEYIGNADDKNVITLTHFLTGDVSEKCKWCGELLYGTVRVHHHTENGIDVT